jgi:hypothetical protein
MVFVTKHSVSTGNVQTTGSHRGTQDSRAEAEAAAVGGLGSSVVSGAGSVLARGHNIGMGQRTLAPSPEVFLPIVRP